MDGDQHKISLASDLEIKHSDMIVSVDNPTFLHNRQQLQGGVLPNSLRYESNGWAIDHYVVNFEDLTQYKTVGDYLLSCSVISFKYYDVYKVSIYDKDKNIVGSFDYINNTTVGMTSSNIIRYNIEQTTNNVFRFNVDYSFANKIYNVVFDFDKDALLTTVVSCDPFDDFNISVSGEMFPFYTYTFKIINKDKRIDIDRHRIYDEFRLYNVESDKDIELKDFYASEYICTGNNWRVSFDKYLLGLNEVLITEPEVFNPLNTYHISNFQVGPLLRDDNKYSGMFDVEYDFIFNIEPSVSFSKYYIIDWDSCSVGNNAFANKEMYIAKSEETVSNLASQNTFYFDTSLETLSVSDSDWGKYSSLIGRVAASYAKIKLLWTLKSSFEVSNLKKPESLKIQGKYYADYVYKKAAVSNIDSIWQEKYWPFVKVSFDTSKYEEVVTKHIDSSDVNLENFVSEAKYFNVWRKDKQELKKDYILPRFSALYTEKTLDVLYKSKIWDYKDITLETSVEAKNLSYFDISENSWLSYNTKKVRDFIQSNSWLDQGNNYKDIAAFDPEDETNPDNINGHRYSIKDILQVCCVKLAGSADSFIVYKGPKIKDGDNILPSQKQIEQWADKNQETWMRSMTSITGLTCVNSVDDIVPIGIKEEFILIDKYDQYGSICDVTVKGFSTSESDEFKDLTTSQPAKVGDSFSITVVRNSRSYAVNGKQFMNGRFVCDCVPCSRVYRNNSDNYDIIYCDPNVRTTQKITFTVVKEADFTYGQDNHIDGYKTPAEYSITIEELNFDASVNKEDTALAYIQHYVTYKGFKVNDVSTKNNAYCRVRYLFTCEPFTDFDDSEIFDKIKDEYTWTKLVNNFSHFYSDYVYLPYELITKVVKENKAGIFSDTNSWDLLYDVTYDGKWNWLWPCYRPEYIKPIIGYNTTISNFFVACLDDNFRIVDEFIDMKAKVYHSNIDASEYYDLKVNFDMSQSWNSLKGYMFNSANFSKVTLTDLKNCIVNTSSEDYLKPMMNGVSVTNDYKYIFGPKKNVGAWLTNTSEITLDLKSPDQIKKYLNVIPQVTTDNDILVSTDVDNNGSLVFQFLVECYCPYLVIYNNYLKISDKIEQNDFLIFNLNTDKVTFNQKYNKYVEKDVDFFDLCYDILSSYIRSKFTGKVIINGKNSNDTFSANRDIISNLLQLSPLQSGFVDDGGSVAKIYCSFFSTVKGLKMYYIKKKTKGDDLNAEEEPINTTEGLNKRGKNGVYIAPFFLGGNGSGTYAKEVLVSSVVMPLQEVTTSLLWGVEIDISKEMYQYVKQFNVQIPTFDYEDVFFNSPDVKINFAFGISPFTVKDLTKTYEERRSSRVQNQDVFMTIYPGGDIYTLKYDIFLEEFRPYNEKFLNFELSYEDSKLTYIRSKCKLDFNIVLPHLVHDSDPFEVILPYDVLFENGNPFYSYNVNGFTCVRDIDTKAMEIESIFTRAFDSFEFHSLCEFSFYNVIFSYHYNLWGETEFLSFAVPEQPYFYFNGYQVYYDDLSSYKKYLKIYSEDINTSDGDYREIALLDKSVEKTIVKQFWESTDKVLHYWWLTNEYVLSERKSMLHLYKKTDEVDDWNGDSFELVKRLGKLNYLNSNVLKHGVTNCCSEGDCAYLYAVYAIGSNKISIEFFNFLNEDMNFTVAINILPQYIIGSDKVLGDERYDTIASYNKLYADSLIQQSIISSTRIGNYILFGIANNKNLNQWCFVIDINAKRIVDKVIGYGYVGLHGELTGGDFPYCFRVRDNNFNGLNANRLIDTTELNTKSSNFGYYNFDSYGHLHMKLMGLDILKQEKADEFSNNYMDKENRKSMYHFDSRIVGTSSKQWYIVPEVLSIVHHLEFDSEKGQFKVMVDALQNSQFREKIDSNGWIIKGVSGGAKACYLADFFIDPAFKAICSTLTAVATVMIPLEFCDYLTTTFFFLHLVYGQYASVWYNSMDNEIPYDPANDQTQITATDRLNFEADDSAPKQNFIKRFDFKRNKTYYSLEELRRKYATSDAFSFDKKYVDLTQVAEMKNGIFGLTQHVGIDMAMNSFADSSLNMMRAAQDVGDPLKSLALGGIGAIESASKAITDQLSYSVGLESSMKTSVAMNKQLDMFYSNSAKEEIYAGPGFVEHNYVNQILAQGAYNSALNASAFHRFSLSDCIIQATVSLTLLALQVADVSLSEVATSTSGISLEVKGMGSGTGTNLPGALSSIASICGNVGARTALYTLQAFTTIFYNMCESTGIFNKIRQVKSRQQSKMINEVEGKHRYGSRNVTTAWPCFNAKRSDNIQKEVVHATVNNMDILVNYPLSPVGNLQKSLLTDGEPIRTNKLVNYNECGEFTENTHASVCGKLRYPIIEISSESEPVDQASISSNIKQNIVNDNIVIIDGVSKILPSGAYKNDNIDCGYPVFSEPKIFDYIIDEDWKLSMCAGAGSVIWISVDDTKIIDGEWSNIVCYGDPKTNPDAFCGVASSYTALEIKNGIVNKYLRPTPITPRALAFNITGLNVFYDNELVHGFDGYSCRIIEWQGSSGIDKQYNHHVYNLQVNDRFKRSNILPPNQFFGMFESQPIVSYDSHDEVVVADVSISEGRDTMEAIASEEKTLQRYSIPIHSEHVSTLPAVVRTLNTYPLDVVEGVTSLTTPIRNTNGEYKADISVDFNINDQLFRANTEYISKLEMDAGIVAIQKMVAIDGLVYIGNTPTQAFFYSQATRCYYSYTGGNSIEKVAMIERLRNVLHGWWDFVNHQVILDTLTTMDRLDRFVHDDNDEIDNIIVPIVDNGGFAGEIWPPTYNIMNNKSWYKMYSFPGGFVFQGPNRCIWNRFIYNAYMKDDIIKNKGKWKKLPREEYHPFREYNDKFESVVKMPGITVKGWTHNPFLLVTSPLGLNHETDCQFEWEIVFAWTKEMEDIIGVHEYICVNVMSETMSTGGKVFSRPTHIFLHKELFTRSENYGYYSFRYTGNNGAGNRERLHIWCDGYIAISSLQVTLTQITKSRNTPLQTQVDIEHFKEM